MNSIDVKTELYQIFQLAWPSVLTYICQMFMTTQCILFCGHLGKAELAAGTLGVTIFNVFGLSIAIGLTSALHTLSAQAFGAKNYRMVGVVLQRGICILSIAMIVVGALWMLNQHFLLLIGMEYKIAKMTDTFLMLLIPMIPACFGVQLVMKYLQTQGIVHAVLVVGLAANIVEFGLHFFLVKGLDQGFVGVPIAFAITMYVQLGLLIIFIISWKVYEKTWEGWSIECLYEWTEFVGLAIPGMLMVCFEWWTFEIGSFLLGKFGEVTVAANGVLLQISTLSFMISTGTSVSAGVLVGKYLGGNDPVKAKLVTKLSLLTIFLIMLVVAIVLMSAKSYIAMAFSENQDVIALATSEFPYLALFCVVDSFQGVCGGIMRGCGLQKLGMLITFISYDIVTIPIVATLLFVADMRLTGMWISICSGVSIQALQYVIALGCTNWDRLAELALERTSKEKRLKKYEYDENAALLENSTSEVRLPDGNNVSIARTSIKFYLLRTVPFIIAIVLLCSTICVRFFVPLPYNCGDLCEPNIISTGVTMNRTQL